jgi:hypothetical protein
LRGFDDIALLDRMAEAHFVEIEPGSPLRLCFAPALPATAQSARPLAHGYA